MSRHYNCLCAFCETSVRRSTSSLRKISLLHAMSPMRPRRTSALAQAGKLVPYAHPLRNDDDQIDGCVR